MTQLTLVPLVIAQTSPGAQGLLVQLFPFALMILIFYLLVLMPMKRRQKKVSEFQAGLKVGDKIITTGGILGQITKVADGAATVQIQIADKVRIEVSRGAVAGYQGQEPVVQSDSASSG